MKRAINGMKRTVVETPLEIKALGKNRGHEGEPLLYGNLYLNNKKVGYVSEGDWGGMANIMIEPQYREVVREEAEKFYNATPQPFSFDIEFALVELLYMKQAETEMKRSDKKKALYELHMTNNKYKPNFWYSQFFAPTIKNLLTLQAITDEDIKSLSGCTVYTLGAKKKCGKIYYTYQ